MKSLLFTCLLLLFLSLQVSCRDQDRKTSGKDSETSISEDPLQAEEDLENPEANPNGNQDTLATTALEDPFSESYYYTTQGDKAIVQVRVGDVDNLGFGWDKGFDPFCGKNTRRHRYPWMIDTTDYVGTDRIMVVSSFESGRKDGYTNTTSRPGNNPVEIPIEYEPPSMPLEQVVLQMMLDDFQAPVWGTSFQFHINGKRLVYVENILNHLNQTGPTGKLVQVGMLPEDLGLFESGQVVIKIDDPVTGAGDGFAIDFIQLLINPTSNYDCVGTIKGWVKDEQNNPIKEALVSANRLQESLTDAEGAFRLTDVPVGMINVSASKEGYQTGFEGFELEREMTRKITIVLKKKEAEDENFVKDELMEKGFVNLYGILFDSGKDIPKETSEPVLKELASFIRNHEGLTIRIIGHTDSDGDDNYNEDLSRRRAQAVKKWLQDQNVSVTKVQADGKGESSPIASNSTDAGKALNRRVEVQVVKE